MMSDKQKKMKNNDTMDSPIRDYLVSTAANFLQNPDVRKRHEDSKINFLKKKGLTDEEISAAFERAELDSKNVHALVSSDQMNKFYPPLPPSHAYHAYSLWPRLSRLSSSLIVFGAAIYGIHHLYKKFIKPWLLGKDADTDSPLHQMMKLTESLARLTDTVEKLHQTVMKQNEDINKLLQFEGCGYAPTPVVLEDLKREISSLKSILINRHQFPAMPQTQAIKATIPSWQLPSSQTEATGEVMVPIPALSSDVTPFQKLEEDNGPFSKAIFMNKESFKTPDSDAFGTGILSPNSGNKQKHPVASEVNGLRPENGEA